MIEFGNEKETGYWLQTEMYIDHPLETVFKFFADAKQLERITPPWVNFKILTPMPVEMKAQLLLDYQISIHKIPIKWRTEIAVWEPPNRFVDRQIKGPYKLWHHEHLFEEIDGRTLMKDHVQYRPIGGALVHKLFVRRDLEKIFTYRQEKISEIFAGLEQESRSPQTVG
jgi:ligand-binding SRPBCC domain-containing protein